MEKKNKLPFRVMLGYSMGTWSDSTAYGFVFSFLSFYFTTVAGISPAVSGIIIAAAIVWDAITDPICGMLMDNSRCKYGKRRPFIAASIIPLGASIVMMFLNVDFAQPVKNIYYVVMVLVFWTSLTAFAIPYYSLGSVISREEEERTKMSGMRQVTSFLGRFCYSTLPTFLVGKLLEVGVANDTAWLYAALVVALIVVVTVVIMWRSTRGWEPIEPVEHQEKKTLKSLLADIGAVMKLKPYLIIIVCALALNVYTALYSSSMMYFVVYNLGLGEVEASTVFTVGTIAGIILAFIFTKLGLMFDKKYVFVVCMCFSGAAMVIAKFVGISSLAMVIVYDLILGVGPAAYYMFIFNFLYDVVDFDEVTTGKRKDGIVMSYYSFLQKLASALASLILGMALEASGFVTDAPVQPPEVLPVIESLFTIIPGIFMLISGLSIAFTPLTRKKMQEMEIHARQAQALQD